MGIPYKIDKKIIEFIIQRKMAEPKLGCRNFVTLIKEKFGFHISKSTVNMVIKEAGLSKRVGRPACPAGRPRSAFKVPKFKTIKRPLEQEEKLLFLPKPKPALPPEKKEKTPPRKPEIPGEIVSKAEQKPIILPKKEIPSKPTVPIEPKLEKPKEIAKPEAPKPAPVPKPKIPEKEKPKQPPKKEKPKEHLPEPKIAEPAKITESKKEMSIIKEGKKGMSILEINKLFPPVPIKEEVFDSMGAFFLKAAEWEISKTSVLGDLVRKSNPQIEFKDSEIKSNTLLYLPAFGIESLQGLNSYENEGLWVLCN